ncbi:thiamine pyrophosphate-binding protein [Gammaproteobacteria bacterium]|nr:thiamine pyrophosphate-binding protein [Gammaproteobacteria bacterium]
MRVGERLAELLVENGVEYVFGVPGGQTLPLYEGISKYQGRIEHVLMRDERSAGYAADAFARFTGRIGVCDGTVGPGATNLVSPMAEAHCSSIPLIVIVSDVARGWEHRRTRGNASQAMDQMEMFQPVSKWQVRVTEPKSIDNIVHHAIRVATTGKPGPVVVCIPDDVASADIEFRDLAKETEGAVYPRFRSAPEPALVKHASQLLRGASKPVVIVGGGAHISGCYDQVRELVEKISAAVVTSISGKGIIEESHQQAFGVSGVFGNPVARDIGKEADVVLFVGCKGGQVTTFNYRSPSRDQTIIHLDIDPEEIGRNYADSVPLLGDATLGLEAILAELGNSEITSHWDFGYYKSEHAQWYEQETNPANANTPLRPQPVMGVINEFLTDGDLVVCDASLSSGWAARYLSFARAGRRFVAPRGLAGLGWGSPATIGASLANRKVNRIIQFTGDGGFGYSLQEMEVMNRFKLPIVTLIFNNDTLGWIKHVQQNRYDQNYVSTDFSHVDFATVAKGFGLRNYTATTLDEVREAFVQEARPDGPALIDVISDQWETPVQGL